MQIKSGRKVGFKIAKQRENEFRFSGINRATKLAF